MCDEDEWAVIHGIGSAGALATSKSRIPHRVLGLKEAAERAMPKKKRSKDAGKAAAKAKVQKKEKRQAKKKGR